MLLKLRGFEGCQHNKKWFSKIYISDFFSFLIVKGSYLLYNLNSVFNRHLEIEQQCANWSHVFRCIFSCKGVINYSLNTVDCLLTVYAKDGLVLYAQIQSELFEYFEVDVLVVGNYDLALELEVVVLFDQRAIAPRNNFSCTILIFSFRWIGT